MKLPDSALIPPHVLARQVGDETVILNLESGVYFGLDSVGARIWKLLAEGNNLVRICEKMQLEFQVDPETLEKDVKRLVHELEDKGLIIPMVNT